MKELWTSMGFLMGVFAFAQSILRSFLPPEFRFSPDKLSRRLFLYFSTYSYYDITELDGVSPNELYHAVQIHLSNSASVSANRLSLTRPPNSSTFTFNLSNNDYLQDTFNGATVSWEHHVTQRQSQSFSWRPVSDEKRSFMLKISKKDKPVVIPAYFDYIMDSAAELRRKNKDRLLYTNSRGGGSMDSRGRGWDSVPFKHPSTFETLAMDPDLKDEIIADLREFSEGKAFYERTGRAWKRGYLLHGPPGTGKSSMIAAMANHLGYDIYDLELTEVQTNSDLRKLLMKTTAKSIIVIEDIDCSLELTNRSSGEKKEKPAPASKPTTSGGASGEETQVRSVTLSGLLNFTDGLWSCCGSERIFVFTTNHAERLDPALLRSGRMDMHIFMGYCSFPALKILVKNYLGETEEKEEERVWMELEEVIGKAEITPADVSEVLIKNRRRGRRVAMEELVKVVKGRVEERKMVTGKKVDGGEEVVEEEEKRTLESPKDGGGGGGGGGTEMTVDEGPDDAKEGKEFAV